MCLEQYLIDHGAPTLAGLKVGNLICLPEEYVTSESLRRCSNQLLGKGLSLTILRSCRGRKLIYLFRPKKLREILEKPRYSSFLKSCGYSNLTVPEAIRQLTVNFSQSLEFPHEVGIFLGYPIDDVIGFITHCGANFKYCDMWKVYGDVDEAKRQFHRYRRCRNVYQQNYRLGTSLMKLAVAI